MQGLAAERIIRSATLAIDPATVAYIQQLLTPYAQAVERAQNLASVYAWIDEVYPGQLAKHGRAEAVQAVEKIQGSGMAMLTAARTAAITYLAEELVHLADISVQKISGSIILPWDIQKVIYDDQELRELFHPEWFDTQITDTKLPVSVTIGGKTFQHQFSEDFVAGLQDYYRAADSKILLDMFGNPLSTDYLFRNSRHFIDRYKAPPDPKDPLSPKYLVTVGNHDRLFFGPDYIAGVTTAAQWRGEDVHYRVTDLRMFTSEGKVVPLTF